MIATTLERGGLVEHNDDYIVMIPIPIGISLIELVTPQKNDLASLETVADVFLKEIDPA